MKSSSMTTYPPYYKSQWLNTSRTHVIKSLAKEVSFQLVPKHQLDLKKEVIPMPGSHHHGGPFMSYGGTNFTR